MRAMFKASLIPRSFANRAFHAARPKLSSAVDATESSKQITHAYHLSGLVLAVLAPTAFVLSPSKYNLPVDILLGIIFPLHSHVAFNYIITDYVPKAVRSVARTSLIGLTVITTAGLLKLNVQGPGITETFKSLWRKKSQAVQ